MNDDDFAFYQKILLDRSGLAITTEKIYLLNARLGPLSQSLGFKDLNSFTADLRKNLHPQNLARVVEAMTTNETSFFRDIKPFDYLRQFLLPYYMQERAGTKKIRIWSAACSTGQEPYSIAMIARDLMKKSPDWRFEIVATDLSDDVLDKAKRGEYNHFEIQRGLSMPVIVQNFTQKGQIWAIKDEVRSMVSFSKFNLIEDTRRLGVFDVIFCRNVLIYFNLDGKLKVLKALENNLCDDGSLFLGSCENIHSDRTGFEQIADKYGLYIKKNKAEKLKSFAA